MKNIFFSLLLITSASTFAMKTSETSEFNRLRNLAKTLDKENQSYHRVLRDQSNFRFNHFGFTSNKYEHEQASIEREFADKAADFKALQRKLFKIVACHPKLGLGSKVIWRESSVINGKEMSSDMCVRRVKEILEHGGTLPSEWDRQQP